VNIKTTLMSSVAAAALLAAVAPAQAGSVSNGNDTASVTLSGHFNRAVLFQDSGSADAISFVDNTASQSRARIIAKGKMNEAVAVSGVFEWGMSTNTDGSVSPVDTASNLTSSNDTNGADSFFGVRHSYVKFDHKQLGSIRIGHMSEATDGATEKNMTGATDVVYGGGLIGAGGIHLQSSAAGTTSNTFSTLKVGDFFDSSDGDRVDGMRYDTPKLGGFSVSTSVGSDKDVDVAGSFGGKMGGFAIGATVGYGNDSASSTTIEGTTLGSIAVGHDSGLNARLAYSKTDKKSTTNKDEDQLSIGLGYKAKLTSMGSTNFAVDYIVANDQASEGAEGKAYVFGVEQETDAGVKFYLGGSFIETEDATVDYEDVTTIIAGTKVFF
jgi:hypothetical protein